jgi:hypothetical protein
MDKVKVKLSLWLNKRHAMKTYLLPNSESMKAYGGVEV